METGGTLVGKTNVVSYSLNPTWDSAKNKFVSEVPEEGGCLLVEVWDHHRIGSHDFLGQLVMKGDEVRRILRGRDAGKSLSFALGAKGGKEGKQWMQYLGKESVLQSAIEIQLGLDEDGDVSIGTDDEKAGLPTIRDGSGRVLVLERRIPPPPPPRRLKDLRA
jgi:hypothetical protein